MERATATGAIECNNAKRRKHGDDEEVIIAAESQHKDTSLWADSAEDAERALIEMASIRPSLLDLIFDVWDPSGSALRNIRVLTAFVTRYAYNRDNTEGGLARGPESRAMRPILTELLELWERSAKDPAAACSKAEFRNFVRKVPLRFFKSLVEDRMTNETFAEWKREFLEYAGNLTRCVRKLPLSPSLDRGGSRLRQRLMTEGSGPSTSTMTREETAMEDRHQEDEEEEDENQEEDQEEERDEYGIDGLFEPLPSSRSSERPQDDLVQQQHVTKFENGRLHTIRSPGEIGTEVIKIDVYNVKDVARVDKRSWWKHAKFRTQFLISSRQDRKKVFLRQLMRQVVNDMQSVSGVTREIKILSQDIGRRN